MNEESSVAFCLFMIKVQNDNIPPFTLFQVHLCEAMNINEMLGDDFLVNRTRPGMGTLGKASSLRVVVKTLKKNADENAR